MRESDARGEGVKYILTFPGQGEEGPKHIFGNITCIFKKIEFAGEGGGPDPHPLTTHPL